MTREEFCKSHWEYYLVLEKDFLRTERYVSFELGDNNQYLGSASMNPQNSNTFSVEYIKQYQAICSEVDVIMKSICTELQNPSAEKMDTGYTPTILAVAFWSRIVFQKVRTRNTELQPFMNWSASPYRSPDWWTPYNKVKHERIDNMRKANLKNVMNALAGLYILEQYLVKYIGDRDHTEDVPNDISKLFEMVNWQTREMVIGRDQYITTSDV